MSDVICKQSDCNFIIPILAQEAIGDSLFALNYNLATIDNELCRVSDIVNFDWTPAYNVFASNSGQWIDAINIMNNLSSCWNTTTNTVNELSGFWLKPITIIYPFPFPSNTDINLIQNWLNNTLPVKNGNCFNYIIGQELYVHSPEYANINRTVTSSGGNGNRVVSFTYSCDCIGRGVKRGSSSQTVDCGSYSVVNIVPDSFIKGFVGIKYTVDSTFQWSNGIKIFG